MKIPQMFYLRKLKLTIRRGEASTKDAILYVFHNYRKSISGVVEVSKSARDAREWAKVQVIKQNPEAEFWR